MEFRHEDFSYRTFAVVRDRRRLTHLRFMGGRGRLPGAGPLDDAHLPRRPDRLDRPLGLWTTGPHYRWILLVLESPPGRRYRRFKKSFRWSVDRQTRSGSVGHVGDVDLGRVVGRGHGHQAGCVCRHPDPNKRCKQGAARRKRRPRWCTLIENKESKRPSCQDKIQASIPGSPLVRAAV